MLWAIVVLWCYSGVIVVLWLLLSLSLLSFLFFLLLLCITVVMVIAYSFSWYNIRKEEILRLSKKIQVVQKLLLLMMVQQVLLIFWQDVLLGHLVTLKMTLMMIPRSGVNLF